MSFVPIVKMRSRSHREKGVCVAMNRDHGAVRFVLTISPVVLARMGWQVGDKAMIMRGEGEHQGYICLKKGQGYTLGRLYKGSLSARLTLSPWPGLAEHPVRAAPVSFNTDNGQLTVDISSLYETSNEHPKAHRD